jgi:hypothetical protein
MERQELKAWELQCMKSNSNTLAAPSISASRPAPFSIVHPFCIPQAQPRHRPLSGNVLRYRHAIWGRKMLISQHQRPGLPRVRASKWRMMTHPSHFSLCSTCRCLVHFFSNTVESSPLLELSRPMERGQIELDNGLGALQLSPPEEYFDFLSAQIRACLTCDLNISTGCDA